MRDELLRLGLLARDATGDVHLTPEGRRFCDLDVDPVADPS